MASEPDAALAPLLSRHLDRLASPCCGAGLGLAGGGSLDCAGCGHRFPVEDGVALLFWPNRWDGRRDVTEVVKEFYERTPFPDYEDLDSAASLIARAERSVLAREIDRQIRPGAPVLEVGCGTGQMTNYLGLAPGRAVFGADLCRNSLRLAEEFRRRSRIDGAAFVQMNLFRPAWRAESFQLVIANGVLHHTSDPALGLESIARLLAPGGFLVVGLYNRVGRLATGLRRAVFSATGGRLRWLDRRLADPGVGARRREAWFQDQYRHPHESGHTIGEVQKWFDRAGLDWVNGIPAPSAFAPSAAGPFTPGGRGGRLDHALVQLRWLLTAGNQGGFFVSIGRKPRRDHPAGDQT